MKNTSIIPDAILEDLVVPTDQIVYDDGWETNDVNTDYARDSLSLLSELTPKGSFISKIYLPIEISGQTVNYLFTFTSQNEEIKSIKVKDESKNTLLSYAVSAGLVILVTLMI
jgi:hypothetical protein